MNKSFPDLYDRTGWGGDAPSEVVAEPFCKEDVNGKNKPGLIVQWKPPQHNGAASILGFEIHLEGQQAEYRCFLIRLRQNVTKMLRMSSFRGEIYPVGRGKKFIVVLHSLPRADDSRNASTTVKSRECDSEDTSAHWTPRGFVIKYDYCNRELNISFDPPPDRFKFDSFFVALYPTAIGNATELCIFQTHHTFQRIEPGEYTIYVEPYNPNSFEYPFCKCRNIEDGCTGCKQLEQTYVAVTGKPCTETVLEDSTDMSASTWFGIVASTMTAVVVFALVAVYVLKKTCNLQFCFAEDKNQFSILSPATCSNKLIICVRTAPNGTGTIPLETFLKSEIGRMITIDVVEYRDNLHSALEKHVQERFYRSTSSFGNNSLKVKLGKTDVKASRPTLDADYATPSSPTLDANYATPLSIMVCFVITEDIADHTLEDINTCANLTIKVANEAPNEISVPTVAVVCTAQSAVKTPQLKMMCFGLTDDRLALLSHVKHCMGVTEKESTGKTNIISNRSLNNIPGNDNTMNQGPFSPSGNISIGQPNTVPLGNISSHSRGALLDLPRSRRERYVSSDSGRGGSECSYKLSSYEDCNEPFNENVEVINNVGYENECLLPKQCMRNPYCKYTGKCISPISLQPIDRTPRVYKCPSGVFFIPPEPSEISESEAGDLLHDDEEDHYSGDQLKHIEYIVCANDDRKGCVSYNAGSDSLKRGTGLKMVDTKRAPSMDSLMNMMLSINQRNSFLMEHEAKTGDVYSVCEGCV